MERTISKVAATMKTIDSSVASGAEQKGTNCCRLQQQQQHQHERRTAAGTALEWTISRAAALLVLSSLCLIIVGSNAESSGSANSQQQQQQQQQRQQQQQHESVVPIEGHRAQQQQERALEAELNSIVQQHDSLEGNNKLLAEAIISRLMLDNLTGSNLMANNEFENEIMSVAQDTEQATSATNNNNNNNIDADSLAIELPEQQQLQVVSAPTGHDIMRLKKLLSFLQNFEQPGGAIYGQYPILPSSQAAHMKRAAAKMGSYLQPRASAVTGSAYGRNNFDFGLGKRGPDSLSSSIIGSSGSTNNILRFGDSSLGLNGGSNIQPVSQFGKRPSAHRYDFGLGKRVASPAYPRYDFGLGKRAPNRARYDFGLGK